MERAQGVIRKHGLTRAQLTEIGVEGFQKSWRVDPVSDVRTSVP